MALSLKTRTGKSNRLVSPHIIKYGTVPAVYLVPHANGWYLYALSDRKPIITVNHQIVLSATKLHVGDVIGISTKEFIVESVGHTKAPAFEPSTEATGCRVSIARVGSVIITDQLLIGTARHCGLRIDHPEVTPVHALIARVDGRWLLYDLTGSHVNDPSNPPWVALIDGDEPELYPLKMAIQILSEEDAQLLKSLPPSEQLPFADPIVDEVEAEPEPMTEVDSKAQFTVSDSTQVEMSSALANRICKWVAQVMRNPKTPVLSLTDRLSPMAIDADSETVYTLKQLERQLRRIKKDPRDRITLSELADTIRDLGFRKQYRMIMREMLEHFPNDKSILRTLVKEYFELGKDPSFTREERLLRFEKALTFLDQLMVCAGMLPDLQDLQTDINVEMTLLRLKPKDRQREA